MNIEDQVCTEAQGRRLEELGVTARPLFCHCWLNMGQEDIKEILLVDDKNSRIPELATTWIAPAYTTAELGEMLPSESGIICWDVHYDDHHGTWHCTLRDLVKWLNADHASPPPVAYESECDTMAEAMSDTLIHCLENKLIPAGKTETELK